MGCGSVWPPSLYVCVFCKLPWSAHGGPDRLRNRSRPQGELEGVARASRLGIFGGAAGRGDAGEPGTGRFGEGTHTCAFPHGEGVLMDTLDQLGDLRQEGAGAPFAAGGLRGGPWRVLPSEPCHEGGLSSCISSAAQTAFLESGVFVNCPQTAEKPSLSHSLGSL